MSRMQRAVAERLRVIRARLGLSLVEAAERTGVDRHTIAALERGKRAPYFPTVEKLAQGYGVAAEEILGVEVAEEPVPLDEAPEEDESGLTDAQLLHGLVTSDAEADRKRFLQYNRVMIVISTLKELVDHVELVLSKNRFDLEEIESLEEVVTAQFFTHKRYVRDDVLKLGTAEQKAALEYQETRMDTARAALHEAYLKRLEQEQPSEDDLAVKRRAKEEKAKRRELSSETGS